MVKTWTGLTNTWGPRSGSDWSPTGNPATTDNVIFGSLSSNYTVTLAQFYNASVNSLTLQGSPTSSPTLVIGGNTALTTGSLNQTGGTIDLTGGTLSVTGVYTKTGGTLAFTGSGNAGTLDLGGGVAGTATFSFSTAAAHGTVDWTDSNTTTLSDVTLQNFFAGDALNISVSGATTGLTYTYAGTATSGSVTIKTASGTIGTVNVSSSVGGLGQGAFTVTNVGGAVELTDSIPCFLRGTRIGTLRGEVAVEDLRIGDLLITAAGGAQPVKWIGTRAYLSKLVHPHHRAALMPIRIAAGALGAGSPVRDLHVSPEHMMCLDDVLVPAGKLLNGTTITRCEDIDVVQYFHIELPCHSVIYADGAAAESFLDTGNRNMFSNVLEYLGLGHRPDAPRQEPCLPVLTGGEALAALRARLAGQAARAGIATTSDADLHLLVDGVAVRPATQEADVARFAVPAGARQIRIVSRSVAPADIDPASGDRRHLGVCLRGLSLRDGSSSLEVQPGYAGLQAGFHAAEGHSRWTSGDAVLPEELFAALPEGFTLTLNLVRTDLCYPPPADAVMGSPGDPSARPVPTAERLSA